MKARFAVLAATVIGAFALLAGCGDDDSSEGAASEDGAATVTVTTSSLSKEEFLEQANDACKRERKSLIGEVGEYLGQHRNDGLAPGVLVAQMVKATLIPTVEAEIAAVRELGAPSGDEEEIEAMLGAQQAAVVKVKAQKSFKSLEEVEEKFDAAEDLYEKYGFVQCVNGNQ